MFYSAHVSLLLDDGGNSPDDKMQSSGRLGKHQTLGMNAVNTTALCQVF